MESSLGPTSFRGDMAVAFRAALLAGSLIGSTATAQSSTAQVVTGISVAAATFDSTTARKRSADDSSSTALRVTAVLQDWVSRLTVNARTYLRYSYETGESRKDYNEFGIDRFYLIMYFQIFERARMRYTLEGGEQRLTDVSLSGTTLSKTSANMVAATKHLFFEYADFLGAGSYVRAGLHDLPWVPYEEDLWGYRVQGNVFVDRSGYLTSADLGVALGGRIADKYGSWQTSLVNGEGWRRAEVGRHKDWHTRITVNPLAGISPAAGRFFVSGFRSTGVNDDITVGPATRTRMIAMAGYKNPGKVMFAAEQLWTTDPANAMVSRYPSLSARAGELSDGKGYTVFGTLSPAAFGATGFASKLDLFGRLDSIDPDDQIADNDSDRLIAGLSWQVHPQMKLLLNGERVRTGASSLRPNESRLLLQSEVRF